MQVSIKSFLQTSQLVLPPKAGMPAVILAATDEESNRPMYRIFLGYIHLANAVSASAILLVRAYVLLLRVDRVLLVRFPKQAGMLRICNALRVAVYRAFGFSVRHSVENIDETTIQPTTAHNTPTNKATAA